MRVELHIILGKPYQIGLEFPDKKSIFTDISH